MENAIMNRDPAVLAGPARPLMDELTIALDKLRFWRLRGRGKKASFSAWTAEGGQRLMTASVAVRRQHGETIEAMIWRGLAELNRRMLDGMPKQNVNAIARRREVRTARRRFRELGISDGIN